MKPKEEVLGEVKISENKAEEAVRDLKVSSTTKKRRKVNKNVKDS